MARTKQNKPGLISQLKRKRELEEAEEAGTPPATTIAPERKRAKRPKPDTQTDTKSDSKTGTETDTTTGKDTGSEVKPAKRSKTHTTAATNSSGGATKAAEPKKENSPAPDAVVDPSLLADYFAKFIRKSFPDDAPVELDVKYLPTKAFLDTTSYHKDRIAANLPNFLETFSKEGRAGLSACEEKGMPHTLIVTSSGMRIANLYRELGIFQNEESKVGKLITKHMKLKKNIEYVQQNKIGIAISTPFRFNQLIDATALNTAHLRRIVVDGSHRDDKKQTIFTLDQMFRPLLTLLNDETIRPRYGSDDKVEILVF